MFFLSDLPAGEARQPLPSHLWRDSDWASLGADGRTLHMVTKNTTCCATVWFNEWDLKENVLVFQARRRVPCGPGRTRHDPAGGHRADQRCPAHHRPPQLGHWLCGWWVSLFRLGNRKTFISLLIFERTMALPGINHTVWSIPGLYLTNKSTDFSHSNDLALLKLDKSPIMNDSVGVACLPAAGEILAHGTSCYISGWGNLYSNVTLSSSVLLRLHWLLQISYLRVHMCRRWMSDLSSEFKCDYQFNNWTICSFCHRNSNPTKNTQR